MAMNGFRILSVILLLTGGVNSDSHGSHEHNEKDVQPYKDLKEMYNITANSTIEIADLQRILDDFSTKLHCEHHADDECPSSVVSNYFLIKRPNFSQVQVQSIFRQQPEVDQAGRFRR